MLNKVKNSLAYRLPWLYQKLLRHKSIKDINQVKSNFTVLMMTGKNHIDLTRLSVLSIASTWHYLPNIIVSNDGSIADEKILKSLNFWKGSISIQSWETSVDYHLKKNRKSILKYADKDPFGKKLAIILHYSEKHPVLWIDSDILFFKDFTELIPKNSSGIVCAGSEDCEGAYHDILVKRFNNEFFKCSNFNAGLLYVSGIGIYEAFELENIIEDIHPDYNFLTEQTIFAQIASTSLGVLWDKSKVKNFNSDNQKIQAMSINNVVARHYTSNVRHLFWRDAYFHL